MAFNCTMHQYFDRFLGYFKNKHYLCTDFFRQWISTPYFSISTGHW